MKKYVKAENSYLDDGYVDNLVRYLLEAYTALSELGTSVRDVFEWHDNQYHNEIRDAIAPVLQDKFGITVDEFTEYCWDLADSLSAVSQTIYDADK